MQHSITKISKIWQVQDHKHQIFQHLHHPAQPDPTQQLPQPAQPTPQGQQIIHVNWSHFKPEFSGKPEEDVMISHLKDGNNAFIFTNMFTLSA